MGDLEDAFLKQNVPGRYSSWVEENEDKHLRTNDGNDNDADDSEDDEYYFQGLPSSTMTTSRQLPPSTSHPSRPPGSSSSNTGVKGVLADYREAQRMEQLEKEEERLERLQILQRATRPAVRNENGNNDTNEGDNGGDSSDDFDDSDDDEFLKQFRKQRIAEIKESTASVTQKQQSALFGTLSIVTPEEYVEIVEKMHPNSYLIVHLYHSSVHKFQMLHSILDKLATSMENIQFIQVNALDANPNLDTICLPAILIYKDGKLVHNLVRFMDEVLPRGDDYSGGGGGFSVEAVRLVLEKLL